MSQALKKDEYLVEARGTEVSENVDVNVWMRLHTHLGTNWSYKKSQRTKHICTVTRYAIYLRVCNYCRLTVLS